MKRTIVKIASSKDLLILTCMTCTLTFVCLLWCLSKAVERRWIHKLCCMLQKIPSIHFRTTPLYRCTSRLLGNLIASFSCNNLYVYGCTYCASIHTYIHTYIYIYMCVDFMRVECNMNLNVDNLPLLLLLAADSVLGKYIVNKNG